jgi:hypothetical protein
MANNNPTPPPSGKGTTKQTKKINHQANMFATFYMQPTSTTFQNVRGSAIRAGYSEQYANNITHLKPKWWVELQASSEYERAEMLAIAQKNIKNTMKDNTDTKDSKDRQLKASTFVSERLGKDHYSTRQELTDKGGRKLFTNETKETADVALEDMFTTIAPRE